MAVGRAGSVLVDVRGSIGEEVYLRTQGGLTIRERVTPTPSSSDDQLAVRAALAAVAAEWSGTLTEPQRDSWRSYAHQHPGPNRWGERSITSGYCAFVKANVYRWRLDEALAFAWAPPGPSIWPPQTTIGTNAAFNLIVAVDAPLGYLPPARNMHLVGYTGHPVSAGVAYYSGPWRLAANLQWTTDDAWPGMAMISPFPFDVGDRVFARLIIQDYDTGAISTPFVATAVAT